MSAESGGGPGSGARSSGTSSAAGAPAPRRRSEVEIRWRQFRNAPRPVVRAVASSGVVATVLGVAYLVYDVALARGAVLPGGDLRAAAVTVVVLATLLAGSLATWWFVPLPRGSGHRVVRSPWSAMLGFLAAAPVAYIVLVIESQVLLPLLA